MSAAQELRALLERADREAWEVRVYMRGGPYPLEEYDGSIAARNSWLLRNAEVIADLIEAAEHAADFIEHADTDDYGCGCRMTEPLLRAVLDRLKGEK